MLNSQASGSTEFRTSPGPSVQFWGISYSPPSQLASLTHYPSEFQYPHVSAKTAPGLALLDLLIQVPAIDWDFCTCVFVQIPRSEILIGAAHLFQDRVYIGSVRPSDDGFPSPRPVSTNNSISHGPGEKSYGSVPTQKRGSTGTEEEQMGQGTLRPTIIPGQGSILLYGSLVTRNSMALS